MLLIIFSCAIQGFLSTQVCECNDNITRGYKIEAQCNKCPKSCWKSNCFRYRVIGAAHHNLLQIPLMQCQTAKGNMKNDWFLLDVLAICDKPKTFYGCFKSIQYQFVQEPHLISSSCRQPYDFKTECSEFYSSIICKNTPEISAKFPSISQSFNIYQPVTFDHFDLIGPRYDYWNPSADSEYELFENLREVELNKDKILIEEIIALAHHSEASYTEAPNSRFIGFDSLTKKDRNIYVQLGYDQLLKSIIVAFRGTTFVDNEGNLDLNNLTADINVKQVMAKNICNECLLHSGFYTSYLSIEDELRKKISQMQSKYYGGLIFTGHSFGAALATIACATLRVYPSFSKSSLVTFGSPRVGNDKFAFFVNNGIFGKNFRVTYQSDPITRVPSMPNYQHVGTQIQFNDSSDFSLLEKNVDSSGNDYSLTDVGQHSGYWNIFKRQST